MKHLLFSLFLLATFSSFSQETKKIKELMQEELCVYDSLAFAHIFQKASLEQGVLHATVLNQSKDIQMYVRFEYLHKVWKVKKIGAAGTFYAGHNIVGRILPGGTANIKSVPDLANERDYAILADSSVWFTSDKSGLFQVYEKEKKKHKKIVFESIKDKHVINLWNNGQSLFFDTYDNKTRKTRSYRYRNGKLKSLPFKVSSISFNDSTLAYIKNNNLFIHHKHIVPKLVQFAFVFTDTTYSRGLTFNTHEIQELGIDSTAVNDGVLNDKAKEKICKMLMMNNGVIDKSRADEILRRMRMRTPKPPVSFSFFFLDTTYTKALQLNKVELEQFGVADMIIDGVLNNEGKAKIAQVLKSNALKIGEERQQFIKGKMGIKDIRTVRFYGFFADASTYVSSKHPIEKIGQNGMISVEGLQEYLYEQEKGPKYTKLLSILVMRAWAEDKKLNLTDTVVIQLGYYSAKLTNFIEHVKTERKLGNSDAAFLRSLNIYCLSSDGYYRYRTKTSVSDMWRIKGALYFDKPFIVKNSERHE